MSSRQNICDEMGRRGLDVECYTANQEKSNLFQRLLTTFTQPYWEHDLNLS